MLESKWIPFMYQYGIGGIVFFASIMLAVYNADWLGRAMVEQ